jgi:hypothetical protein
MNGIMVITNDMLLARSCHESNEASPDLRFTVHLCELLGQCLQCLGDVKVIGK